jgi:hypothetical protein
MVETIGTYTPENFFAGDYPIAKETITVAAGEIIKRHAPVKLNTDGEAIPVIFIDGTPEGATPTDAAVPPTPATTAAENTSAGLYGISAGGGEDGAEIVVYLTGEYLSDALALEEDVTIDMLKLAFRRLGIFFKEAIN